MIGPTYIHVPDGHKVLRVTAFRRSQRPQIIRIGGAHAPSKMSTVYEFANVELRPNYLQSADVIIPAQTTGNYWLAIQVFTYGSAGWNQSAMRANAPMQVPEVVLAFDDCAPGIVWSGGGPSVELTILYS